MIYLDWASTAPVCRAVREQLPGIIENIWGNPSSIHHSGRKAARLLEASRENIAGYAGCDKAELIFTSGATESNNMVLFSLVNRGLAGQGHSGKRIIISGIEHPSVYTTAICMKKLGFDVIVLKTGITGIIDPEKIREVLTKDTLLVAIMWVNNETGAIQPVKKISGIIKDFNRNRSRKVLFHCDAVQAFGKIKMDLQASGVDSAALSAHKIGGLKGAGALYLRKGTGYDFLFKGGKQEYGIRPGTENLAGIFSFSLAAAEKFSNPDKFSQRTSELMTMMTGEISRIKGAVLVPGIRKKGVAGSYSSYILKAAFPPVPAEVLVRVLEDNGILVSTGSACSSGDKSKLTRVLTNMKVPGGIANSSIRISISPDTTEDEIKELIDVLKNELPKLKILAG